MNLCMVQLVLLVIDMAIGVEADKGNLTGEPVAPVALAFPCCRLPHLLWCPLSYPIPAPSYPLAGAVQRSCAQRLLTLAFYMRILEAGVAAQCTMLTGHMPGRDTCLDRGRMCMHIAYTCKYMCVEGHLHAHWGGRNQLYRHCRRIYSYGG